MRRPPPLRPGDPVRILALPPPLRPGDAVRVVAPASPFDPETFERGVDVLRSRFGLVPRMRPDISARRGYLAGEDARRLEEWREAVADPDARAIFCARGGYGAMRLLPALDAGPLLAAPKLFVGFSDLTAFHAVLNRAGVATVHGPVLTQLGRAPAAAVKHLEALLFGRARGDGSDAPAPGAGVVGTAVLRSGRAIGPVLGGSLSLLAHLAGTPFAPHLDGAILLLEDVGERPYRLDRYLTQLRLTGALARVAGVVVGQLLSCEDGVTPALDVVREAIEPLGVPCIAGVEVGHADLNLAVPLGPRATLVAPAQGERGPPRLLFDEGATA